MSRYLLAPTMIKNSELHDVIVGYDGPLDHFFAQVVEDGMDTSLDGFAGFATAEEMAAAVAPYATLTLRALRRLERDRRERAGNVVGVLHNDGMVREHRA